MTHTYTKAIVVGALASAAQASQVGQFGPQKPPMDLVQINSIRQAHGQIQQAQEMLTQLDTTKIKEYKMLASTDEFNLKMAELGAAVGELNRRDYEYSQGMLLAETFGDEEENWEDIDFTQDLTHDHKLRPYPFELVQARVQWWNPWKAAKEAARRAWNYAKRKAKAVAQALARAAAKAARWALEKARRLAAAAKAAARRIADAAAAVARKIAAVAKAVAKAAAKAIIAAAIAVAKAAKAAAMLAWKLGKMLLNWKNVVELLTIVIGCVRDALPSVDDIKNIVKSIGVLGELPLLITCVNYFKDAHTCYEFYKSVKSSKPQCYSGIKAMLIRLAKKTVNAAGLAQMSAKESNRLVLAQVSTMLKSKAAARKAVKKTQKQKLLNTKTATKAVMAGGNNCPKGWLQVSAADCASAMAAIGKAYKSGACSVGGKKVCRPPVSWKTYPTFKGTGKAYRSGLSINAAKSACLKAGLAKCAAITCYAQTLKNCSLYTSAQVTQGGAFKTTQCARENGTCKCKGVVRFGKSLTQKYADKASITSVKCTSSNFGGDPAPGIVKKCWCSSDSSITTIVPSYSAEYTPIPSPKAGAKAQANCSVKSKRLSNKGWTTNKCSTKSKANGSGFFASTAAGSCWAITTMRPGCLQGWKHKVNKKAMFFSNDTPETRDCVDKKGRVASKELSGRVQCAKENGVCKCIGKVRFGTNTKYTEKQSTGQISCSRSKFGDPAPYVVKHCTCSPEANVMCNQMRTKAAKKKGCADSNLRYFCPKTCGVCTRSPKDLISAYKKCGSCDQVPCGQCQEGCAATKCHGNSKTPFVTMITDNPSDNKRKKCADKDMGKQNTLSACAAAVKKSGGSYFSYGKGNQAGKCYVEVSARRCKTVDFALYTVDMKNSCRNRNIGVYPSKCLVKKGCDTCDQVPCGQCQEGCAKQECYVNGQKRSKNGCANGNMGKFPVRSTCLSGEITAANYATVAPKPKLKRSVIDRAIKGVAVAGECIRWFVEAKDEVANCLGLMKFQVIKDLNKCRKTFNPAKLKQIWSTIKKTLKIAKMVAAIKENILFCILKEYGKKIIEKAMAGCTNVLNGTAKGCPKTGFFSVQPYAWWCDKLMWVRKFACMAKVIILG